MNKCIFLDRDGVLNQDLEGYLFQTELLEYPEGVKEGLAELKDAGFLLIVITNQAGIAKGLYTASEVEKIHRQMNEVYDGVLDDLFFAPHHEDYTTRSLSRKPGSLLIERATAKYRIDLAQSWMIGDNERDIEAGSKAGVRTILLKSTPATTRATVQAGNFKEAVQVILSASR
jgi:D-glycero-D-manno-heptose 1,7-bisphosphate phosphatase